MTNTKQDSRSWKVHEFLGISSSWDSRLPNLLQSTLYYTAKWEARRLMLTGVLATWGQNWVKFLISFFLLQASHNIPYLPREKFFKTSYLRRKRYGFDSPMTLLPSECRDRPPQESSLNLQLIPEHDQLMATSLSPVQTGKSKSLILFFPQQQHITRTIHNKLLQTKGRQKELKLILCR